MPPLYFNLQSALPSIRAECVSTGRRAADREERNEYVQREQGAEGEIYLHSGTRPTHAVPHPHPPPHPCPCSCGARPGAQPPGPTIPASPSSRPARPPRTRPAPQAKAPPPRSLGGDGERLEEAAPCQPAEGRFSFTCHVALQMMALPGSSGSPRPGLSPLTWG